MKKIALIIAVTLCGIENLQSTGNENIEKLNATNEKIKEISSTLELNQNKLEKALQDLIAAIESNSQWYQMNISLNTQILQILADENKGNPDIVKQVQSAQAQLDQISKSLKSLQNLEAPLKAALGPVLNTKRDIDQIKQSLTRLSSDIYAIESQVPPLICKNYSGTIVEGYISPSSVRGTWNLISKDGSKYYVISPNVGLVGQGTEYVISRTVQGWVDKGILGPDGKVACMYTPTPPVKPINPPLKPITPTR